jgi:hypothetical protein
VTRPLFRINTGCNKYGARRRMKNVGTEGMDGAIEGEEGGGDWALNWYAVRGYFW